MNIETIRAMNRHYPSNVSEALEFESNNCARCYKRSSCTILFNAQMGTHPKQWVTDSEGNNICTSLSELRPKKKPTNNDNQFKLF